jgi:hypothetical protein
MLAMALPDALALSSLCTHIKGHGGLKATVSTLHAALPDYRYVMKTDVKRYYESIDHTILLKQLNKDIADPFIWRLLVQFVKRSVERGGTFKSIHCGISRGCSLSPVIAAYYLTSLDKQMEGDPRYFYRRYMDDVIVLAKTHWHLRNAVRTVNQHFNLLKGEKAPDKTLSGRLEKVFDFLGYQFGEEKLSVSKPTLENHIRRLTQLYEQKKSHPNWMALLDDYRQRWVTWVYSGIPSSIINVDNHTNFLDFFLNRRAANPIKPNVKIASVVGSETV